MKKIEFKSASAAQIAEEIKKRNVGGSFEQLIRFINKIPLKLEAL